MSNKPKRAVIYARISRDDNVVDGYSDRAHERQIDACAATIKSRGWTLVEAVTEKRSAYGDDSDRPAWDRVLTMMRNQEVDVLVAWKIDRLTRSVRGLLDLIQIAKATEVAIVTSDGELDLTTPTGPAVATILATIAQLEVEVKAQRQVAANLQAAKRGQPFKAGWRPFGYSDSEDKIREDEAALIRKAAAEVLDGKPLREVAREWRASGLATPRTIKGGGWTHQGVKSVLLNPRNAGFSTYKGEIVGTGQWNPILTHEVYHQLVAFLQSPSRRTNHSSAGPGRPPQNLLTGIARCGICGDTVWGRRRAGRPVYTCPTEHLSTSREEADEFVLSAMRFESMNADKDSVFYAPPFRDTVELQRKLEALTRRELKIAEGYGAGTIPEHVFEAATQSARAERERLLVQISEIEQEAREFNTFAAMKRWDDMPLIEARGYLKRAAEITLYPKYHRKNIRPAEQVVVFVRKPAQEGSLIWMLAGGEHPDVNIAVAEQRTIWGQTPLHRGLWEVIDRNDQSESD